MNAPPSTFDRPSSRPSRSTRARRLFGVAALTGCFVVTLFLLLGIGRIVQAQSTADTLALVTPNSAEESEAVANEEERGTAVRLPVSSAVWQQNFGKQSALSLRMPSAFAKSQTMQNLIIFANRYGDALDLSDAVPALVSIYERDADDRLQIMALAALHAIGDAEGMERVLELFADPYFRHQRISPRLRHMTHIALAEYLQEREQNQ